MPASCPSAQTPRGDLKRPSSRQAKENETRQPKTTVDRADTLPYQVVPWLDRPIVSYRIDSCAASYLKVSGLKVVDITGRRELGVDGSIGRRILSVCSVSCVQ